MPRPDLTGAPRSAMPKKVKPMLATLVKKPFDDSNWLFETKWDGFRAIAGWDGKKPQLYSRNGSDFSLKYNQIVEAVKHLTSQVVLDGEIVAVDSNGHSHFEWLQNWQSESKGRLHYYVFDILWCNGHDLRGWPLLRRKQVLKTILPKKSSIHFSDHVVGRGKAYFETAKKRHWEGIVAKESTSTYIEGHRGREWLKVKTHLRQEVVVGGFTEPKGGRKYIGSLAVGVYENGQLVYSGHSGGGIPTEQLKSLRQELEKLKRPDSPFVDYAKSDGSTHWVEPKLIAEVIFTEWTQENRMRHPVFVGLREDKNPSHVKHELPKDIK